ncbi:MAG: Spo0E family sporulation regulatory protein-aspartic acid phosphatase [bacterium]
MSFRRNKNFLKLHKKLEKLTNSNANLHSDKVVKVSQKLDRLIIDHYKEKINP